MSFWGVRAPGMVEPLTASHRLQSSPGCLGEVPRVSDCPCRTGTCGILPFLSFGLHCLVGLGERGLGHPGWECRRGCLWAPLEMCIRDGWLVLVRVVDVPPTVRAWERGCTDLIAETSRTARSIFGGLLVCPQSLACSMGVICQRCRRMWIACRWLDRSLQ